MRKSKILLLVILLIPSLAGADVIRMKDGRIFIGKVYTVTTDGVVLLAAGEKVTVKFNDIFQTDPDFSNIKTRKIEITLKDDTKVIGTIKDFDADIGLLVESDLGIITLPPDNIKTIMDEEQKRNREAHAVQLGAQGGYFFVVGDLNTIYYNSFSVRVFGELNLSGILPGLFAGANLSFHNLPMIDYTGFTYLLFDLNLSAIYRFLQLRSLDNALRGFVPFVGVGAGAAFPLQSVNGAASLEVDFAFSGFVGLDFFVSDEFSLRLCGTWTSVLQSQIWFNALAVNLGFALGL